MAQQAKKLLSEQEYQQIEDYVASTAPPGLTEDEFYMLVDQELASRQSGPSLPPVPMPDTNSMAGTRGLFGTGYQIPTNTGSALKELGGNVLKSGAGAMKGMADLVYGGMSLQGGQMTPQGMQLVNAVSNPGQLAQGLKDRYGSADALAQTAWEDPVGLGLDASGIASGGASLARGAGNTLQGAGRGLMRRAANVPEKAIATSPYALDDMTIPQTMLDQGINPTTGGRRKLDNIIAPLGEQKRQLVEASNQTFNAHDPRTTQGLRDFIGEGQIADSTSPALAPAGQNVLDTFTGGTKYNRPYTPIRMSQGSAGRPIQAGPVQMTPETQSPIQLASNDKVNIGRQISDSAWATNPVDAATEANTLAQRALYGDLQAVEAQIPGVAGVNRQLSPLSGTRDHLVKGLGVPEHYVPRPNIGGAFSALMNNSFGAAGGFGARGAYQAGQGLGQLGQAIPMGGLPAIFAGGSAAGQMGQSPQAEAFQSLAPSSSPSQPFGEYPSLLAQPGLDLKQVLAAGNFQEALDDSDPLQSFGPQPRGPQDDWWSPQGRLRP